MVCGRAAGCGSGVLPQARGPWFASRDRLIPAPGGPIGAGQRAPASARSALGFTHVGGTGAYTMATHEAPKHCADRVTGEPGSAIRYTKYNYRILHHKKESHGLCLYKTVCFTRRTRKKEKRDAYQVDFCTPATPRTPGISHVRSSLPSPSPPV